MLIYETQEYHNYQIKNATSATLLNLTGPLFFGGVPNNVKLHPLVTQRSGFSGCINSFEYHSSSSSPKSIDLSKPSESHKTQGCVSNAVAGFGLNRTSWLKFGKFEREIPRGESGFLGEMSESETNSKWRPSACSKLLKTLGENLGISRRAVGISVSFGIRLKFLVIL